MITKNAFFCKKFYNVAEIFYMCILFFIIEIERKTQNFSFSNFQNELRATFFFVKLCLSNFFRGATFMDADPRSSQQLH